MAMPDDATLRDQARATYDSDEIKIDDDATISTADTGAWVAAWVWVPIAETEEFDPTFVTIERLKFSDDQGVVKVYYSGREIDTYADKIELVDDQWQGYPDSYWIETAARDFGKLGGA
jgi:hypothetical protein